MSGFVLEFSGNDNGEPFWIVYDTEKNNKVSLWYGSLSETEFVSWNILAESYPGVIRELLKFGILKETK